MVSKEKVLVVDDDPITRELIGLILDILVKIPKEDILAVDNVAEALEAMTLPDNNIRRVVLDVYMTSFEDSVDRGNILAGTSIEVGKKAVELGMEKIIVISSSNSTNLFCDELNRHRQDLNGSTEIVNIPKMDLVSSGFTSLFANNPLGEIGVRNTVTVEKNSSS